MRTRISLLLVIGLAFGWALAVYSLWRGNRQLEAELRRARVRAAPVRAAGTKQEEPWIQALQHVRGAKAAPGAPPVGIVSRAAGDLDGDGESEVAVLYTLGLPQAFSAQGWLAVLKESKGVWRRVWSFEVWAPQEIQVRDLNADGRPEVFVANRPQGSGMFRGFYIVAHRSGRYVALLEATVGECVFHKLIDLNGDGRHELVVGHYAEAFPPRRGHAGRYGLGFAVFAWDGKAYSAQDVRLDRKTQAIMYRKR